MYMKKHPNSDYYRRLYIDGGTQIFNDYAEGSCWEAMLYDFKPWLKCNNRKLYRTKTYWIVYYSKNSAVKYISFWKAFLETLGYKGFNIAHIERKKHMRENITASNEIIKGVNKK